jgi:hypothetical protein
MEHTYTSAASLLKDKAVKVARVNVDKCTMWQKRFDLKGTPMVFFITKGKVRELDHRNSRCGDVYHF